MHLFRHGRPRCDDHHTTAAELSSRMVPPSALVSLHRLVVLARAQMVVVVARPGALLQQLRNVRVRKRVRETKSRVYAPHGLSGP